MFLTVSKRFCSYMRSVETCSLTFGPIACELKGVF